MRLRGPPAACYLTLGWVVLGLTRGQRSGSSVWSLPRSKVLARPTVAATRTPPSALSCPWAFLSPMVAGAALATQAHTFSYHRVLPWAVLDHGVGV